MDINSILAMLGQTGGMNPGGTNPGMMPNAMAGGGVLGQALQGQAQQLNNAGAPLPAPAPPQMPMAPPVNANIGNYYQPNEPSTWTPEQHAAFQLSHGINPDPGALSSLMSELKKRGVSLADLMKRMSQ